MMIFSRAIVCFLLEDLGYYASAYGTAAFSDREAETFVHGDRSNELNRHLHVVPWHHHLHALGQLHASRHVGRAEVELRTVTLEERRVSPTLFLGQHINLGRELGVGRDTSRLGQHHPALHVLLVDTSQE